MAIRTKRKANATGFEGWYSYYAGFPVEFATAILRRRRKGCGLVLDPWNGSGTTTTSAACLGIPSVGVDLNPVARVLALARLHREPPGEFSARITRALKGPSSPPKISEDDPLLSWFSPEVAARFRALQTKLFSESENGRAKLSDPSVAFSTVYLIKAARRLLADRIGSNPTWLRLPNEPLNVTPKDLSRALAVCLKDAVTVLGEAPRLPTSPPSVSLLTADVKQLPLSDASVELILTSPPYCTRIDYAVATAFELSFLGVGRSGADFRSLRRKLMGTTCIRPAEGRSIPNSWPRAVRQIVEEIRDHPSYESSGYYFKNIWQYFSDADRSIAEINRVMKAGGVAYLVVQTSYYKNICIDLPRLYREIGHAHGLKSTKKSETAVPRSLADINTKARKHLKTRRYSESLIALEKS